MQCMCETQQACYANDYHRSRIFKHFHKIDDIIRVQNYSCNDSDIDPMWMKEAEEISDG